jgi:Protein of unknown function (DUF3156)
MWNAGGRASRTFGEVLEAFELDGFEAERRGFTARLTRNGAVPIRASVVRQGRIFGGTYALELSTDEPVLTETRGLRGRPRGIVKLGGVDFRSRGQDDAGRILGARLERDERLQRAVSKVHFDQIRVEPDGRPVIRHMGGSVVWMLFPPLVRPVPLVQEQRRASVEALEAFARAGGPDKSGPYEPRM